MYLLHSLEHVTFRIILKDIIIHNIFRCSVLLRHHDIANKECISVFFSLSKQLFHIAQVNEPIEAKHQVINNNFMG